MTTPPQPQNKTSHSNNHHHHHHHQQHQLHHHQQHHHQNHSTTATSTAAAAAGNNTNNTSKTSATTTTTTTTTTGRSRKRPAPGSGVPLSSAPLASAGPQPSLQNTQPMSYLGSVANIYSTVPGTNLVDAYRNRSNDPTSPLNFSGIDPSSQIALVNRGANTLVRMPYNPVPPGVLPGMNMMGGVGSGIGLGQVIGPPGQGDGMDPFDRELQMRIDKMRKKRASIPPFVQKLSSFVNDPKTDALIRWSPSGNSFLVLDEDEFSKTLIPDLFKHNNYASFVRQLNMYGFHKVVGLADGSLKTSEQRSKPPSEYENPYFKRGQPDLMWLISKPKGKGKRKNMKNKQEDSDNLDDMSEVGEEFESGGGGGRGYIEGPKSEGQDGGGGGGHHQQSGGRRPDISAVIQQLESVKNHQAMISAAINRLRKDHNQLYEQSVAFQTLHDRHENSINAILTFLATVYDKSLGGNINGTFSNLFQNQVEHAQSLHPQGGGAVVGNPAGAIVTPNRQPQRVPTSQMTRRRQLLLENGPMAGQISEEDSPKPQLSPTGKSNGMSMKPMGSPITQNYQTYQSPSIQELGPSLSQEGPRPQQDNPQYATRQPQPYANIFSLPDSPIAPIPSPNMNHAITSPVSSHSLTPRLNFRNLVTPGLSAQTLQEHNAQLAQKAREIEELEELQAAQNSNVDELMDMMNKFADTDAEHPGTLHNGGAGNNSLDGTGSNIDEFLNWGIPGDLNGDGSMGGAFACVDGDTGLQGDEDLNALFTFQGGDNTGGGLGVDTGMGVGQILGTNPSTVVTSPAGSSGSRAREDLEEDAKEVQVKRRRIGKKAGRKNSRVFGRDDELGLGGLELFAGAPVKDE